MKKMIQIIGIIIVIFAIGFILAHSFVMVSDGLISKDLFGLVVPNPPIWISSIPYLGDTISFIYHLFSLHGLVGIAIFGITAGFGAKLIELGTVKQLHIVVKEQNNALKPKMSEEQYEELKERLKKSLRPILKKKIKARLLREMMNPVDKKTPHQEFCEAADECQALLDQDKLDRFGESSPFNPELSAKEICQIIKQAAKENKKP